MRRSSHRVAEDRLATFLRGLVIGAFVGAIIASSAALRARFAMPTRRPRVAPGDERGE